ncbi:MAG: FAD-binding protein [Anaerolineaceae bacterium]|nr:FAD-binding protein [Anaerolineaceae bacterium]
MADQRISKPITRVHTLVIGSGAAGLNAAIQLHISGVKDVMILTEGLSMGTSINTGSDKQTYYKLSMYGSEADSIYAMAEVFFSGGGMHGDLALVEASLSARAFMHLVNQGVPFPRDEYGQFVGYKTDHDPRQRATSIGPYTSQEMCKCLIREAQNLGIKIREQRTAVQLVVISEGNQKRIVGVVALNGDGEFEPYLTENVIFAVGGPGGIYDASVYPKEHIGAIGLAFMAGANACNLTESQFGLASTKYRWNVSGTYMQVIPRLISRASDGISDEREFLQPYFNTHGEMHGKLFLKGYQWPFDASKVIGGSSIIDILVYIEREIKGRRVYLDYRNNPENFSLSDLPAEASEYLSRSLALQETPLERLKAMNPGAVKLYLDHGIDLSVEPLEIAVSAQHNNGGLAGNIWWESTNIRHFFPVGEVNGSHGLKRPGGAALNAGQVGGFRAAEFIANCYGSWSIPEEQAVIALQDALEQNEHWVTKCVLANTSIENERTEMQKRMSKAGAFIRTVNVLEMEVQQAWQQAARLIQNGCKIHSPKDQSDAFNIRQLCVAHAVYLDAILFALKSGVGSRGSAIVLEDFGLPVHPMLANNWRIQPENESFRKAVLQTCLYQDGAIQHTWTPCRPIPKTDSWFETTWGRFRSGEIYRSGVLNSGDEL